MICADWEALDSIKRTCSQAWGSAEVLIPSGRELGTREAFLDAFDTATLQVSNRLFGQAATCRAEAGFTEVAPWNRREGYLVGTSSSASLSPEGFPGNLAVHISKLRDCRDRKATCN